MTDGAASFGEELEEEEDESDELLTTIMGIVSVSVF